MKICRISVVFCLTTIATCSAQLFGSGGLLSKRNTESENLIVTLSNPIDSVLQPLKKQSFPSKAARAQAVTKALKDATAKWQAPVLAALKPFGVETESYWVSNQIFIRNSNPLVKAALLGLGFLKNIAREIIVPVMPIFNPSIGSPPNGTEWGVQKIGAEEVWKQTKGEGVRVGVIDTGVRASHVALKDNYVGRENNGWFDPILSSPVPTDNNG